MSQTPRVLAVSLLALAVTACGSDPAERAADDPRMVEQSAEGAETAPSGPSAPDSEASEKPEAIPTPTAPATGAADTADKDLRIPETVEDANWKKRYSPDIPYFNRGETRVPAFLGANPRTAKAGDVPPGGGGYIEVCAENSTFCKITFDGGRKSGYVNMDLMSGEAR